MDLLDLIEQKRFLGQEFLIWLWRLAEERGGNVSLPDGGEVTVIFEKHMLLESGQGPDCEKLVCRGEMTELREARAGLALGKRPEQARLRLVREEREYSLTLTASTLEFRSMKLPAAGDGEKDRSGIEGQVLERIFLIEEGIDLINGLFRRFVTLRASEQWPVELAALRQWISKGPALAAA